MPGFANRSHPFTPLKGGPSETPQNIQDRRSHFNFPLLSSTQQKDFVGCLIRKTRNFVKNYLEISAKEQKSLITRLPTAGRDFKKRLHRLKNGTTHRRI
jgi:hypothetical protein